MYRRTTPGLFSFYINDLPSKLSRVNTSTDIDILLYADDLDILASSKEKLQHKLNVLSVYCKDRNLNVNVNKSKVIVFNSIKNTEPFMYTNLSIDEVDSFKYQGMTFYRRANLKHSWRILIQQALKAMATLECHVNKHKYMPVR